MNMIFFTAMIVAIALTLIALTAGIVLMGIGGDKNSQYGNRLMKARVILQGAALLFFALTLLTAS